MQPTQIGVPLLYTPSKLAHTHTYTAQWEMEGNNVSLQPYNLMLWHSNAQSSKQKKNQKLKGILAGTLGSLL